MTKPRISQVLLWILALVTLALFGFFVALVAGAIPVGEPPPPARHRAAGSVADRARRRAGRDNGDEARATDDSGAGHDLDETATTTTTEPAKNTTPPALATVVVTAARGDCWISARLGSETGQVLDERLLAQGESVTLRGEQVWMSIGAAANVDVTVNGQDRELQSGTVAVVLARRRSGRRGRSPGAPVKAKARSRRRCGGPRCSQPDSSSRSCAPAARGALRDLDGT